MNLFDNFIEDYDKRKREQFHNAGIVLHDVILAGFFILILLVEIFG
jgi:hypothetical protein